MQIDGVFAGGGVKAFAFIGALKEVERCNHHFVRVAGTSAGAIVASMIQAGYTSDEMKRLILGLDLNQLLDPTPWAKHFPHLLKWLSVYWALGLYKGKKMEEWLSAALAEKGVRTFGDLPAGSLRIVAADLSHGRILVIPDDLPSYGIIPETFPVARAVRMSCSLPFFFQPIKMPDKDGKTATIVDGAILSNFPMWLFRREKKAVRPVIGFQLRPEETNTSKINNAVHLYGSIFETMQKGHDSRYIENYNGKNVVFIPVESVKTTSFTLEDKDRHSLIDLGATTTKEFLKKWCG